MGLTVAKQILKPLHLYISCCTVQSNKRSLGLDSNVPVVRDAG